MIRDGRSIPDPYLVGACSNGMAVVKRAKETYDVRDAVPNGKFGSIPQPAPRGSSREKWARVRTAKAGMKTRHGGKVEDQIVHDDTDSRGYVPSHLLRG